MKPNIYSAVSAADYLQDYYKFIKEKTSISLREWATQMGFDSSNVLIEMLKGKRSIKLKYVPFILKGMDLTTNERIYFQILTQKERAQAEDQEHYNEILKNLRLYVPVNPAGDVVSHWLNIAILALSKIENFALSAQNIQSSLTEKVSLEDIENSLTVLMKNGLLSHNEHGQLRRHSAEFFRSPEDVPIQSKQKYYEQVFARAQNAIGQPVDVREFQCFSISLSADDIIQMKKIMRGAREELSGLWNKNGDRVYQINLQAFPIAEINCGDASLRGKNSAHWTLGQDKTKPMESVRYS